MSKLFEFLLDTYPIPTNFAFCGLIIGSLPFIVKKVKGHSVTIGKIIPFLVFFAIVILMAMLGETGGKTADVTFGLVNVIKLFFVGVVAAATMVVPGVSGSMMLMLLGYYDVILKTINLFVDSLVKFDMAGLMQGVGVLAPFGVGVLIGIGVIAKLIEFIFQSRDSCLLWNYRSDRRITDCDSDEDELVRCFRIYDRGDEVHRRVMADCQ